MVIVVAVLLLWSRVPMPTIDIRGTSVAFPFKPYNCQLDYIGGVLEALSDAVGWSVWCLKFFIFEIGLAHRTADRRVQKTPPGASHNTAR